MSTTMFLAAVLLPMLWMAAVDPPFEVTQCRFTGGDFKDEDFEYLVLPPITIEPGKKYPLVLFLHGAGERGTDPAELMPNFPYRMATTEYRRRFECFLIIPQCRPEMRWVEVDFSADKSVRMRDEPGVMMSLVIKILDTSIAALPIDHDRIYLTGLSMGGYGSWELAMRRPELFAAVLPVCGGGDETQAHRLIHTPVWAFHGDQDNVVPVHRSRQMIQAIREAGGEPRYSELRGVGHNSWNDAYGNADGGLAWMFSQRRSQP
jgi:predicted peptidase